MAEFEIEEKVVFIGTINASLATRRGWIATILNLNDESENLVLRLPQPAKDFLTPVGTTNSKLVIRTNSNWPKITPASL